MVNTDEFIKRLEIILDYYGLSASGFADKIGVQRSSLSHLLSGRNKPSLDLILKIVEVFPEIDLYWILNGVGAFPKSLSISQEFQSKNVISTSPTFIENSNQEKKNSEHLNLENNKIFQNNLFDEKLIENENVLSKNQLAENSINENKNNLVQNIKFSENSEKIEKIMFFFADGSFKEYNPK